MVRIYAIVLNSALWVDVVIGGPANVEGQSTVITVTADSLEIWDLRTCRGCDDIPSRYRNQPGSVVVSAGIYVISSTPSNNTRNIGITDRITIGTGFPKRLAESNSSCSREA